MAGASRDQALALLAAANNHGDLAVKLSSLRQAKDILLAVHPSFAAELFPYLVELQSSPETLVRKSLIEWVPNPNFHSSQVSICLVLWDCRKHFSFSFFFFLGKDAENEQFSSTVSSADSRKLFSSVIDN